MGRIAALLAPMVVGLAGYAMGEGAFAPMSGEEIRTALTDARVDYISKETGKVTGKEMGKDNGIWQLFHPDGRTLYVAGGKSWGTWHVTGDQYCSTWPPSSHVSCFDMTRMGEKIRFLGAGGDTYEGVLK